jgi:phage terminase large subunit-like protein
VTLTARQQEAQKVLAGPATHILLEGGSRSGKTFLLTRAVAMRALKAPKSRHAIFRFRFNHIKASIIADTFPKVMESCFPGVKAPVNRTDWFAEFENGSQIWFGGLDDKDRTEKILGSEYSTVYLNEISQIKVQARDMVLTRLAQKAQQKVQGEARELRLRFYYDLNPTNRAHWGYKLFHDKIDPESKRPLGNPEQYAHFRMNPEDNASNLSAAYLDVLRSMSSRQQKRFLRGEWADATPNALFPDEVIDSWRVIDGKVPEFVRVVVGVDPSGSGDEDNQDNDAIGILIAALGTDGNAYVVEDCTVKAGPATWGRVATSAFDRHAANVIVGEVNYGGDMVRQTIQTARPRTPFKKVTATRGKAVRAEPFSALYEQGKVRHVGNFPELEDELAAFSTFGYTGTGSPNRADALIWALAELFPGMTKGEEAPAEEEEEHGHYGGTGWMAT